MILVAVVVVAVDALRPAQAFPTRAVIAAATLILVVAEAVRCFWRVWSERSLRPHSAVPAVVIGLGQAGMQSVHSLTLADPPRQPRLARGRRPRRR